MDILIEYGLFLAKSVTLVVAGLFLFGGIFSAIMRGKRLDKWQIEIRKLNEKLEEMSFALKLAVLDSDSLKKEFKEKKKNRKQKQKESKKAIQAGEEDPHYRKRLFVLNFEGDISASPVSSLREEITTILTVATPQDEIVLCLESSGGMVHSYGLAASQLHRIKKKGIPLTICVDKVAASGGYMMACLGDRILASPFAILGSIGVVAQIPNFNRLLKKNDIDVELLTAGEYKRTVTMFGENTKKGKQKFLEELEDTHGLFKEFVGEHRPQVEIQKVATGEMWLGKRALEVKLVDELKTSDEYLSSSCEEADVYEVTFTEKKSLSERFRFAASYVWEKLLFQENRW